MGKKEERLRGGLGKREGGWVQLQWEVGESCLHHEEDERELDDLTLTVGTYACSSYG